MTDVSTTAALEESIARLEAAWERHGTARGAVDAERDAALESANTAITAAQAAIARANAAIEQANADVARAHNAHAEAIARMDAERATLAADLESARAALARQREVRAKAQNVIRESLARDTLAAMLRARIEATCEGMDEATIADMVEQALNGMAPAPTAAQPDPDHAAPPAARRAGPEGTLTLGGPAVPAAPSAPAKVVAQPTAAPKTAPVAAFVPVPETPPAPKSNTTTEERFEDRDMDLAEDDGAPPQPVATAETQPKAKAKDAGKAPVKPAVADVGTTKIVTFDENEPPAGRPSWVGNPFKK